MVVNKLIVFCVLTCCLSVGNSLSIKNSAYYDIIIDIREVVPVAVCNIVLENLEKSLKSTSQLLFTSLDGRAYFGSVVINLPDTWPDSCVPISSLPIEPSQGGKSDFTITDTNLLYGNAIWTQQSGGCGLKGDQIYISYRSLEGKTKGRELVKEWSKYRYGIFDEIGFYDDKIYPQCYFKDSMHVTGCSDETIKDVRTCTNPNPYADMVKTLNKTVRSSLMYVPQGERVTIFCDEGNHDRYAPTKHNLLCDRKSTSEVILKHDDFSSLNLAKVSSTTIKNTVPVFNYRRRKTERYIVVIDDTQEILLRESWSFLRNAIRKWVVYDLRSNSEVGIVLAGGTPAGKILPITSLNVQKNRDLVASFVPYAPSDSRQSACLSCAIHTSLEIFKEHRKKHGNSSHIIVVLAPGMDFATDYNELAKAAFMESAKIVTINFPSIERRQPLDILASLTEGLAFTISEKKYNSEKSYLNTYFELAEALFYVNQEYHEGPAYKQTIEIHRKELVDVSTDNRSQSKRATRTIQGTFFLEENMGYPSGFFIYTHNTETPLIQNIRLTSPSGVIYNTRSDQRMPVKQLTILANINETGAWSYMIERFNGNPQPHFVQVMATPTSETVNIVRARGWIKALQAVGPFIIYCEVKRGDYPVLSAFVNVRITRPDASCNYTQCETTYRLLDTGGGDPDITKGDGIYSRYVSIHTGPGMYKFEIFVDDNGNTAHSIQENASIQNIICCGSIISAKQTRQTVPFQRYLPPLTLHLSQNDIDSMTDISIGRIGDLIINYLDEGKVRLTWTTPDMAGQSVARYEIKFAFTMEDIVDRYDTAAILWNHDTPYPYDVGDPCSFILDINREPRLFGQATFFAIRPYSKLATNAVGGPVSNVVRTFIPNKIESTSQTLFPFLTSEFLPKEDGFNFVQDVRQNNTIFVNGPNVRVRYSIPIIAGTLLVLLIIALYFVFCRIRRRRENKLKSDRTKSMKHESSLNEQQNRELNSAICSNEASPKVSLSGSPVHHMNEVSSIHATSTTIVHNYATVDNPDHQTIGIPIYNSQEETQKKRLSTSSSFNGITQISSSHDYLIDELKSQPMEINIRPIPGYYTANCSSGGLSIISNQSESATLPRPGGPGTILSPYETWNASQLLHKHERQSTPLDKMMNQLNLKHSLQSYDQISNSMDAMASHGATPPPVPPLPYAPDIYHQLSYPYVYGTMPKQHYDPITNTYRSNIHPVQSLRPQIPYNNQTLFSSSNCHQNGNQGTDKKRRNITMV